MTNPFHTTGQILARVNAPFTVNELFASGATVEMQVIRTHVLNVETAEDLLADTLRHMENSLATTRAQMNAGQQLHNPSHQTLIEYPLRVQAANAAWAALATAVKVHRKQTETTTA